MDRNRWITIIGRLGDGNIRFDFYIGLEEDHLIAKLACYLSLKN